MKKVLVGMSGGVDSSIAAYLLKQQGYEVVGLFMKNWEELDDRGICRSTSDFEDASRVCDILRIPLYSINFVKEYWDRVFSHFIEELKLGYTPNPDILCNREIKFDALFEKAKELGGDFLATGHYCRVEEGRLLKGADPLKDQSYFLHAVKGEVLQHVLFPIGSLSKPEVRRIAKEQGLPIHDKRDSTGICFIGKRNFKTFIQQYIPYQKGLFENTRGEVIGEHDGAAFYTIGQRKGLGIGGPGDAWFVTSKDMERNVVVVEQGADHPSLYAKGLIANTVSLVCGKALPNRCRAKIRYRGEDQPCSVEYLDTDRVRVTFDTPQRAITPRQSIVFYKEDCCLGGAFIEKAIRS